MFVKYINLTFVSVNISLLTVFAHIVAHILFALLFVALRIDFQIIFMRCLPKAAIAVPTLPPTLSLIQTLEIIWIFQAPSLFVLNLPYPLALRPRTNHLIRPVFTRHELVLAYSALHSKNIAHSSCAVKP